jgi:diguanylate cyclase (GGDEF)-like protein
MGVHPTLVGANGIMSRRKRLRHRLYAITAINAAILLGLTALLTYRAWQSHREVRQLVRNDGGAISELQQLQRNHNGWVMQWLASSEPQRRAHLSERYGRIVAQLVDSETLSDARYDGVREAVKAFGTRVSRGAPNDDEWHELSKEGVRVGSTVETVLETSERAFERRIPDLENSARDTMLVAVGIVYIIAIFSFVVAKQSLEKVVSPIERLVLATQALASGDLTRRVPISGDHEVAELTRAFNSMAADLEETTGKLEQEATTDELTQLPNFRTFEKVMQTEVERASRYEEPFGILIFDIDHFKRYNDTHGHAAGNEALKLVANVIRREVRAADVPARYGGEEFVAILPKVDAKALGVVAERVRKGVEALPAPEGRTPITISAGGAIYPYDGHDRTALFAAADRRLYEAKEGGRNKTVVPK